MTDRGVDAGRKILSEPVALIFDDEALKVRRNLLIFSTLAIFIGKTGIKVNPHSNVSGIQFDNLLPEHVLLALLILNTYHLIHFFWFAMEGFFEWRLRLTGMKLLRSSGFDNVDYDFVENPRQSTLYNWWTRVMPSLARATVLIAKTEKGIAQYQAELQEQAKNNHDYLKPLEQVNNLSGLMHGLINEYEAIKKLLHSERLKASIERFDGWFNFFQKSQSVRWLLIETLLPLTLGIYAVFLLVKNLYPCLGLVLVLH